MVSETNWISTDSIPIKPGRVAPLTATSVADSYRITLNVPSRLRKVSLNLRL